MRAAERTNRSFDDVELEVLGFDARRARLAVAAEWKFPPALCEALRYHHHRRGRGRSGPRALDAHSPTGSRSAWASASSRPVGPEWPEEISRTEFQIDQHSIGALESEIRAEFLEGSSLKAA